MALDGDKVDDDDDRDMFCIPRHVLQFVEKAVYRSLSVQSPSQRFVFMHRHTTADGAQSGIQPNATAYSAYTTDADGTVCIVRRHDVGSNLHRRCGLAWARPDLPLKTMLTMQLGHPTTLAPAQASAAR